MQHVLFCSLEKFNALKQVFLKASDSAVWTEINCRTRRVQPWCWFVKVARDAQAKPLENCKVYFQNVNKCERSERNTRVNSTNLTDQVLILRVFSTFSETSEILKIRWMVLNPGKNCNTQPKTKDKELKAPSLKESFFCSNLLSISVCLEFLFGHFGKSKTRESKLCQKKSNGMEIKTGRLSSRSGHDERSVWLFFSMLARTPTHWSFFLTLWKNRENTGKKPESWKLRQFSLVYTQQHFLIFSIQIAFVRLWTEFFSGFCSMFCLFFLPGWLSCKLLEREISEKPPWTKTQTDRSASVLVSAVSPVSCRLTRKTVKKSQSEPENIHENVHVVVSAVFWVCTFKSVVDVCVCVSICGCKKWLSLAQCARKLSVCGQRVVRHGVSEVKSKKQ